MTNCNYETTLRLSAFLVIVSCIAMAIGFGYDLPHFRDAALGICFIGVVLWHVGMIQQDW